MHDPPPQPLPVYLCRIETAIVSFLVLQARCKSKIIDSKKDGNLQHPPYTLITSKKSGSYTNCHITSGNCDWREGGCNQGFSRVSATLIGPPRLTCRLLYQRCQQPSKVFKILLELEDQTMHSMSSVPGRYQVSTVPGHEFCKFDLRAKTL